MTRKQRTRLARCNARLLAGISIDECAKDEGLTRAALYQMMSRAGCRVIRRIVHKTTGESVRDVEGVEKLMVGIEPDLAESMTAVLPEDLRYEFLIRVEQAKV